MAKSLLLYASFGEGHKQAALSLKDFLNAPCKDLLDFCPYLIKKAGVFLYLFFTERLTFCWNILFFISANKYIGLFLGIYHKLLFFPFFRYLRKLKPDVVITTHFFPPQLLHSVKKELGFKVISIVTDLKVHPLWVNSCVDYYCVASDPTKADLMRMGIEAKKITSNVVSIREGFLNMANKEELRKKFTLDNRPCILFMASLQGHFPFLQDTIEELIKKYNIFIIYGRNKQLKKYLQAQSLPSVRSFSFYEDVWELFQLASVVITKPGGLTSFEGMYLHKPFIFTHYIPGQEKENMELLIYLDIAKYVQTKEEFLGTIDFFVKNEKKTIKEYPISVCDIRPALKNKISLITQNK